MNYKRPFNLLEPIKPPTTLWDKIYDWVLWRARIVVLVTIIAITLIFVGKVIVDTDAKNKTKEIASIQSKLRVLESSYEPEFRNLFRREDAYTKLWNASNYYSDIISEINSYVSSDVKLSIRFQGTTVTVFGTESLSILNQIEIAMKSSSSFKSVFVNSLVVGSEQDGLNQGDYILTAEMLDVKRTQL
jgi:hypothetical protein